MPQCPQCNKPLVELTRRCPSCMADLDLLVDYVSHLEGGLVRANNLTRAGELGQAVWAYLEVLEVDPDNPTARYQIGQVATAVRQFDRTAPGRRWLHGMRNGLFGDPEKSPLLFGVRLVLVVLLLLLAFSLGYSFGNRSEEEEHQIPSEPIPKIEKKHDTLSGK
jgi:tetratricopeptide repeat protein